MRIGIDLGGTKIEIALMDAAGALVLRRRVATPTDDYDGIVRTIAELVRNTEKAHGIHASVGVGIPGAVSPKTGLIRNANTTCLIGKAFDRDLGVALARTVRLANDANCFALSEAVDGAGQGYGVVFGVILGTGVGAGIVVDGNIHSGRNAIAGEWGHNPLPWPRDEERPGLSCYCGKHGCIETFLSGGALTRNHGGATAQEFAARADTGDSSARAHLERYFDRAARSLAHIINVLDPDVIVLGGGLSNMDALYTELPSRVGAYVFSEECSTPIVKNAHGDSGGVRGAAWLWPDQELPSSVRSGP